MQERGVAVVGMGYWGKNLVRAFHNLGVLHSVCDAEEGRRALLAEKYPEVGFCTAYSEVLANPKIRAVALATPAVTHVDLARAALLAGKDVFVEKPIALTVAAGQELVAIAERLGRVLMVGHILRYHPAVRRLQELVNNGALGELRYLYSNRLNIGKIRTEENILWSFAPHDLSVLLGLLAEMPSSVSCQGGDFLSTGVSDVTVSQFLFPSGVRAHIFVSWLHPFKEQRLVVVGSEKMAVFDDQSEHKLVLYSHKVEWRNRHPNAIRAEGEIVPLDPAEPLLEECRHFLECLESRRPPLTDGHEALRVLRLLDTCERSVRNGGLPLPCSEVPPLDYFVHPSACVDQPCEIGRGTKIWHFCHVLEGARIGQQCILGQNVSVAGGASLGNNVKVQNNVSIYTGTEIEDDVFLGPSCVLTNVTNPRAQVNRHALYECTRIRRGATIGANATIVCGVEIGRYAFVGAGAVVVKDVPDYALVVGNPARPCGWMSRHGVRLPAPAADGLMVCPESGYRYRLEDGRVRCLDLAEDAPLPPELAVGKIPYDQFKR